MLITSAFGLGAQTASDLNEGLTVSYDSDQNQVSVRWWTKPGYFYFLLSTDDLANGLWTYCYATLGDASAKGINLSLAGTKMFFRLELTNDVNSPTLTLDQDGDKVSSLDELLQGTNPFLNQSLDGDAIPDDWEIFHGLDTTPGVDSSGDDLEADGATTATEFASNTDPNYRDHPDLLLQLF